jgi:hypothetical protein
VTNRDFDASRRAYHVERDPVCFTLGGESFDVVLDPSLGDTFDLYDAPEVRTDANGIVLFDQNNGDDIVLVRTLQRFIERSIPIEQRPAFQRAMYRIPAAEAGVIIECAMWIVEQMTSFPTEPPGNSSSGRQAAGADSNTNSAGNNPSN